MADIANYDIDEAKKRTDAQKAALLQAIAEGGKAGALAYSQGQGQVSDARAAAMRQMNANAQGSAIQADPSGQYQAYQSQLNAQGADPYAGYLAAGNQSYEQDVGRTSAASGAYMDEMSAALPLEQETTNRALAGIREEIAERARERAHAEQMRQMELRAAELRASQMAAEQNAAETEDPRYGWERERMESRQLKTEIDQYVDSFSPADKALYDAIFHGQPVPVPNDKQHLRELAAKDKANKARLARFYEEAPAE